VRTFTSRVLTPVGAAALLAVGMLAGPAFAAEETTESTGEAGDHADESDAHDDEASGFGTGEWDGLILAAFGGLLVGGLAFASSGPGQIGKSDDHH